MAARTGIKEFSDNGAELCSINRVTARQRLIGYKKHPGSFILLILVVLAAAITVGILLFLVGYVLIKGLPNITAAQFSVKYDSENVSMLPAIVNTVIMVVLSLIAAVPVGIFSAVYLTEYAKRGSKAVTVIRLTAETLSGIPSIVYGLFGFLVFVVALGWSYSMLSGVLTMSIMILPLIIRTTEEALMSVPDSYREGGFGLGAGRLRTVFRIVLPSAAPGIFSGIILAIGRIVGESAALIFTAGTSPVIAKGLFSSARTLSVHIYALYNEGLYTNEAFAASAVLLAVVLIINAISDFAASRLNRKNR